MQQPLIILGMHRSGTSMISRVLRHQGLFLGHRVQDDDESLFFLYLNHWLMQMAAADWDEPLPAARLSDDPASAARLAQILRKRLSGWGTRSFLGPHWLAMRGRIDSSLPLCWGFKDPRSAITLPVWQVLFPGARFLRIRRHGIDVAQSLVRRNDGVRALLAGQAELPSRLGGRLPRRAHTMDSPRCRSIEGALGLWQEYEETLDRRLAAIAPERQMTLRYEDYVRDPAGHHRTLAEFVGLPLDAPLPDDLRPDPARALAYRADTALVAEARRLAPCLNALGYEA